MCTKPQSSPKVCNMECKYKTFEVEKQCAHSSKHLKYMVLHVSLPPLNGICIQNSNLNSWLESLHKFVFSPSKFIKDMKGEIAIYQSESTCGHICNYCNGSLPLVDLAVASLVKMVEEMTDQGLVYSTPKGRVRCFSRVQELVEYIQQKV